MLPVIFGCAGLKLTAEERRFFAQTNPAGFILFARNCESPRQIRALTGEMRDVTGREQLAILIDQEGGRVTRLGSPHWRNPPAAGVFGEIYARDKAAAERLAYLNSLLIAADLRSLGITVDCLPVLDIPAVGADPVIGDRAYGCDPESAAVLGGSAMAGLLDGGCLPVIKHIPGHGRANVDSHLRLPVTGSNLQTLSEWDFAPFRALASAPFAMTAHMVYSTVDKENCATFSPAVIQDVIRGNIGFSGILMSDDLSMGALGGNYEARARRAIDAGCDLILHCNGKMDEMTAIAEALTPVLPELAEKLALYLATSGGAPTIDRDAVKADYQSFMTKAE